MSSPSELVNTLASLPVTIDVTPFRVTARVDRYFSANASNSTPAGRNVRHRYHALFAGARPRADVQAAGISPEQFQHVFQGIGRVEDITFALRLAVRYRLYQPDVPHEGPGGGFDPAAGVRHVTRNYVGLDCCGFVFNWLRSNGTEVNPWTSPEGYADRIHPRRAALGEILANDLVVYDNKAHVALVDAPGEVVPAHGGRPARLPITLCESFGEIHAIGAELTAAPQRRRFHLRRRGRGDPVEVIVGPFMAAHAGRPGQT